MRPTGADPSFLLPELPSLGTRSFLLRISLTSPAKTTLQLFYLPRGTDRFTEGTAFVRRSYAVKTSSTSVLDPPISWAGCASIRENALNATRWTRWRSMRFQRRGSAAFAVGPSVSGRAKDCRRSVHARRANVDGPSSSSAVVARSERRSERLLALGIFAVLLVSYAYFTRAAAGTRIADGSGSRDGRRSHLSIDRYHTNTGDKAKFGGHYYSDKAPACRSPRLPAYALYGVFASTFDDHTFSVVASYAVTVFTVGVASALLGTLLVLAARKLGASRRGATIAALGLGLGSIAFPFSTMLFSHQLAALLLFASFFVLFRCREKYSDSPLSQRECWRRQRF